MTARRPLAERMPRLDAAALACAERLVEPLVGNEDLSPQEALETCNVDPAGLVPLLQRARTDMAPVWDSYGDRRDDAEALSLSGITIGIMLGALATFHAQGHPSEPLRANHRMTDEEVDGALGAIARALSRNHGPYPETPDGQAQALRALGDVRAVFREATGIGAR